MDQFDRYQRIIRQAEAARKALEPFRRNYDHYARLAEAARSAVLRHQPAIHLVTQHRQQMDRVLAALPQIQQLADVARFQQDLGRLFPAQHAMFQALALQARAWEQLIAPMRSPTASWQSTARWVERASGVWNFSMVQVLERLEAVRLIACHAELAARLLEPYRVYTSFTEQTARRLE